MILSRPQWTYRAQCDSLEDGKPYPKAILVFDHRRRDKKTPCESAIVHNKIELLQVLQRWGLESQWTDEEENCD